MACELGLIHILKTEGPGAQSRKQGLQTHGDTIEEHSEVVVLNLRVMTPLGVA